MTGASAAPPDEVTAPWWEATREHRLLLQTCTDCDGVQHPPRSLCARCGSTGSLGWREASGAGVVDTFTAVHRSPDPDAPVPYVIARVRLREGPLLLTRLEAAPVEAWAIDDPVSVAWQDLDDGRALPVFHPDLNPDTAH